MDDPSARQVVERSFRALPIDFEVQRELHHQDFVEVFPQSGETIRGHENYVNAHERHPAGEGSFAQEVRSVTGGADEWVLSPAFTLLQVPGRATSTPSRGARRIRAETSGTSSR